MGVQRRAEAPKERKTTTTYGYLWRQHDCDSELYKIGLELVLRSLELYNPAALEIVDQALGQSYKAEEVIPWIHATLLSVQDDADKRPIMQEILFMITNYSSRTWTVPC
ncbi:hypothetical protein DM860_003625 [Cuscuta australis]|uniref:Uncharacterized protein n=1 Tax=Cuscuta australis TaxID=267555 RepID=A0A328DHG3_9ASTE|nr:hypothetical protein DM860_003625 [Cuscuta australis]